MKHLSKKIIMLVAALLNLGALQAVLPMAQAGMNRYARFTGAVPSFFKSPVTVVPKISIMDLGAMKLNLPQLSSLLVFKGAAGINIPSAAQMLQMSPVKNWNALRAAFLSRQALLQQEAALAAKPQLTKFQVWLEKFRAAGKNVLERYASAEVVLNADSLDYDIRFVHREPVVVQQEYKNFKVSPLPQFVQPKDPFLRECNARLNLRLVSKEDIAQLPYEHQEKIAAVVYTKLMNPEDQTPFNVMADYVVACNKIAQYHPELDKLFIQHKDSPNITAFGAEFKKLAQKNALPQELQTCFAQTEQKTATMGRIEWGTFCWKLSKKF